MDTGDLFAIPYAPLRSDNSPVVVKEPIMPGERFSSDGLPTPESLKEEQQLQEAFPAYRGVDPAYVHAGREALERWWDWKFGLRIHWGLYSITGNGAESWPLNKERGGDAEFREQYESLAKWWNPSEFSADQWADMMVRAGLKFFTFTTKHHDGFSMYHTATRVRRRLIHTGPGAGSIVDCDLHYSIQETPFGRDVVRELVDACRRRGLGIALYFSHIDWFDSDFRIDQWNYQRDLKYTRQSDPAGFARMIARHREQVRELCTRYGPIDALSLDMCLPDDGRPRGLSDRHIGTEQSYGIWQDLAETIRMARRLQPRMLLRNRGIGPYGDYHSPERTIPADPESLAALTMPWKVIYPGGKHFSHNWHDQYREADWIISCLVDITAKGGNFQVGYGPMPSGAWAGGIVRRLEAVGDWLKTHGEGIYCTRPYRTYGEGDHVRYTRTKDHRRVYAFLLQWPVPPFEGGAIRLESIRAKPGSQIQMLGLDHNFRYSQDQQALTIELPHWLSDPAKRPSRAPCAFRIEAHQ
jgi:alpha-L-fucosidase